jgi:hypothetical protein
MGRPIKSKFFGNRNRGGDNENTGGTGQGQTSGVGGESVRLVTFSNSGTLYSQGTTVSFGQPNIAGGIRATGTPVIDANGLLRDVTITEAGTGYTSAPTLTVTTATRVTTLGTATNNSYTLTNVVSTAGIYIGMRVDGNWAMQNSTYVTAISSTGTVSLSKTLTASTASVSLTFTDAGSSQANSVTLFANTTTQDSLAITSYLTTGSSAVSGGDIIKQESSRRYLVRNSQGIGQVALSAGTGTTHTLAPGFMHLVATDNGGATYYVMKLTAHKATLVNRTSTSTAVFGAHTFSIGGVSYTGGVASWTLGSITSATSQVSLAKNA